MIVCSSDITVYFINPDKFKNRFNSITALIKTLNVKKSIRVKEDNPKLDGALNCTSNHIEALRLAIENNTFPCLVLEDDVHLMIDAKSEYLFPDGVDMIYLGGSNYNVGLKKDLLIKNYCNYYYRVFNMLALHSVVYTNKESANRVLKIFELSLKKEVFCDVEIANNSEELVMVTPKDGPYFYQDSGTTENVTRFKWKDLIVNSNILEV